MIADKVMRLVQLQLAAERRVAVVDEPHLRLLGGVTSVYELAVSAIQDGSTLPAIVSRHLSPETVPYDPIYCGESRWKLLPPIDHPAEPARCLISGTGLTHLGSAKNRSAMHELKDHELTDSIRIFQWGLASGKPPAGSVGVPAEWFYKGNGTTLRTHREPLLIPAYAEDTSSTARHINC